MGWTKNGNKLELLNLDNEKEVSYSITVKGLKVVDMVHHGLGSVHQVELFQREVVLTGVVYITYLK